MRLGHSFRLRWRYHNDPEYRKRQLEYIGNWNRKHRKRKAEQRRKIVKILNEFRNKHCGICGKLLHFRTKHNYCRECYLSNTKLLMRR